MIITNTDQTKKHQKSYIYKPEIKTDLKFSNIKIALVLPAFNEEKNIGYVLSKISPIYTENMDIIVVDDGSSDKTVNVAKNYDTLVLCHQENRGNGAATITGLNFCENNDYDLSIILDADGQHDPNFIPLFIKTILKDKADFVIGNRFKYHYDMNPVKKICSKLLTVFYLFLYRKKISDPSNGYRALSKKILQENSFESNYSITQEMLFKVLPNYKCKEIPIQLKSRREGQSFIKIKKYFGIMISSFLKFYILKKLNKIYNLLFK